MSTHEAFKDWVRRFLGHFPLISPCVFERRRKWTGRDWNQHHHRQSEDLNVLHGQCSSSLWGGGQPYTPLILMVRSRSHRHQTSPVSV